MRLSLSGLDSLKRKKTAEPSNEKPREAKSTNSKTEKKPVSKKKILIVVFSVLLLTFSSIFIYFFYIQKNFGSMAQIETSDALPFDKSKYEDGVFVGNVVVYWADLERKYNLLYPSTPENWSNLANWKNVLNQVNADAILQNEATRQGLFESADNSKLDPIKINRARNHFNTKGKEYVSGEVITIWFNNGTVPNMGLDEAEKLALDFITQVRAKIISNELTIKAGGDLIATNFRLADIDPSYQANAYSKFTYISPDQKVFHDDFMNKKLWELNSGEVSEVIKGHDFDADSKYDAFYAVIKVNEKTTRSEFPFSSADHLVRKRILEGYKLEL